MKYIGEKDFRHGQRDRAGVLLVNLGTPNSTEVADVRRYLAEFLSDPRIVEAPRLLWKAVLHGIILRTRPRKSAEAYKEVWTDEGSPLLLESQKITQAVAAHFEGHDIEFGLAMRYGDPSVPSMMEKMRQAGVRRLLVLPMYPQYSATTSGSVMDAIYANLLKRRWMPELRTINQFFDQDSYIEALAASVRESWETNGRGQKLVLSYHGVPKRYLVNGDPYHCQCHKTSRLLADKLGISSDDYMTVFQSRFGREEWLQP
ncbi:MAG: ferrochelatase, partial [Gammaproteobacteria bacterium]|nr:ferrochelatase [Gammaproteobacteria bacterium]